MGRRKPYVMTKSLPSLDESASHASGMEAVEVIIAEVVVGSVVAEDMEGDAEDLMAGRDDGFAPSAPGLQPVEESPQIALLAMRSGPSRLREHPP